MNKVFIIGRITKDPDIRYTQGENPMTIARYTIAVDRRTKDKQTDFISCIAFGKQAEFCEKYLNKGNKIAITGRIQTGSYTDKNGNKVYTTDVVVDDHEFAESKPKTDDAQQSYTPSEVGDGFMQVPDGADAEGLPWN